MKRVQTLPTVLNRFEVVQRLGEEAVEMEERGYQVEISEDNMWVILRNVS